MGITVKIAGVDRTEYVDARSLSIVDELNSINTASFAFICNDVAMAPIDGQLVLIEEGSTKLFSGRILSKEGDFLNPNLLKYRVECIDHSRDLNKKLVVESYLNQKSGDIFKDIITKYTSGFTTTNVADGPEITKIAFDYIQVSEALDQIAETCGYQWYVDYDRDVHFFLETTYPASFQLDDDQKHYKDLNINSDISQLRNRIYVRSSQLANVITRDDQDSIDAVKAIEGGDGIHEFCITDNNIDTEEWANDRADADLLQNADPVIKGTFITNQSEVRSGQIITLSSTKRDISQDFLIYRVELVRVDVITEYPKITYKPATTATIGYKPAADAEIPYRAAEGEEVIYYVYNVTIATKFKGLGNLLLSLLYHSNLSLKRDSTAPAVPSGLTLSTGMGLATQATLAWLKAEWSANSESDLSYYELRMKKSTDSDFTVVSTKNITFIWYSLEPGVTFDVYIRAIDTSGNASDWSSVQSKTTATDSDTPVQLAAPTATAILAGIKITWNVGTEDNISHYKIERQESVNDVDWSEWATIVNTDTTMWLDLLLTYTKYYRYRVSTVTQTGNSGNPSDPSNSVQPNKAGTNDIVANAITADLIAANSIYTNALQAGAVIASKIATGTITTTQLNFTPVKSTDVIARINASAEGLRIEADNIYISGSTTFASGYNPTGKIASGGAANDVNTHVTTINGGKITTYSITATQIHSDAIETIKIKAGAVTASKINVDNLAAIKAVLGTVHAGLIYGTRFRVGGGTNEDIYFEDSGIRLYDASSNTLRFYKSGLADLHIIPVSNGLGLGTSGSWFAIGCPTRGLYFYNTGFLKMPSVASQPSLTGKSGSFIYGNNWMHIVSDAEAIFRLDVSAGW